MSLHPACIIPALLPINLRPDGLPACPFLCPQGLEFDRVALADDLVKLVRDEEDMIMMADDGHFFNPQQARPDPEVRCLASVIARAMLSCWSHRTLPCRGGFSHVVLCGAQPSQTHSICTSS